MRAVNLLPKDAERASRTRINPPTMVVVVGGALGCALLFSMYMSASQRVQDNRSKVDLANARSIMKPQGPEPLNVQVELATETKNARISALNSALAYRLPWDSMLGDVAKIIPKGVLLGSLNVTAPASATGDGGDASGAGALTMTGTAYSFESVVLLANRLGVLPEIASVKLGQTTRDQGSSDSLGQSVYTFNLTATLKAPQVAT